MSAALRLVPLAAPVPPDDAALRPRTFDDYIGQAAIIANLRTSVRAAKLAGHQLDHMLMTGGPGLGKTSLAGVIAAELGARLRIASAPAISHRGELATLLIGLEPGDVLFIDEIHRLATPLQEMLYSAMEDGRVDLFGPDRRAISMNLPRFTLLGATTHAGLLSAPLLDRFGFVWQLQTYTVAELTAIVQRSARELGIAIDPDGVGEIARRSRGVPRIANRLLRRVRDVAIVAAADGALVPRNHFSLRGGFAQPERACLGTCTINGPLAALALDQLEVDAAGLDGLDRAYLAVLAARHGAPVGIEALASALSQQRATIEDVVEPFLVQLGLIARTPRGRVATEAGVHHLTGGAL